MEARRRLIGNGHGRRDDDNVCREIERMFGCAQNIQDQLRVTGTKTRSRLGVSVAMLVFARVRGDFLARRSVVTVARMLEQLGMCVAVSERNCRRGQRSHRRGKKAEQENCASPLHHRIK
jgi:hypothetical protein